MASTTNESKKKGAGGILGKQFQKMRRRLTVTGATKNIDGEAMDNGPSSVDLKRYKGAKTATVNCAVTEYYGVSKKGHAPYNPKKKNQDAIMMVEEPNTDSVILLALDGHGEQGDHVSAWFRDKLPKTMFDHPSWTDNMNVAISDSIQLIEKNLLKNYKIDTEFSGTTLTMAIVRNNHLTGVNIGDSRVILGREQQQEEDGGEDDGTNTNNASDEIHNGNNDGRRRKIVPVEVTHDHKPDSPEEKERILSVGGRVFSVQYDDGIDGPPRVWLGHTDIPGLAMSRSLGDVVAHSAGVISEPDFTEFDLDPNRDKFLVIASDGLWEFVTNEETVDYVVASSNDAYGQNNDGGGGDPVRSVDTLVTEAGTRWMQEEGVIDDTSIIVANLFGWRSSY